MYSINSVGKDLHVGVKSDVQEGYGTVRKVKLDLKQGIGLAF